MRTLAERASLVLEMADNSITKLANIAGVKPPSVSDWLNGKTKTLKAGPSLRVAKHFGISQQWLTEGVGQIGASANHLEEMTQNKAATASGRFFSPIKIFLGLPIDYLFRCA